MARLEKKEMDTKMTLGEHLSGFSEFASEKVEGREILNKWFKELVMIMRHDLRNIIIHCQSSIPDRLCPSNIVGHFLMAESGMHLSGDMSRDVYDPIKNEYMPHVRDVRLTTGEDDLQVEKYLWVLFLRLTVIGGDAYENELDACFNTLMSRRSRFLCLMLWLFPRFATPENMDIVEGIVADPMRGGTSLLRDRMLFGLASIGAENLNQEKKTKVVETQIHELQDSVTQNGDDFRSDAIGLLMLVSCAKRNSGKIDCGMVWQMAQRVVERLIEFHLDDGKLRYYCEPDVGWAYFALCEYVNLLRLV